MKSILPVLLLFFVTSITGCSYFTSEKDIIGEWKYIEIKTLHEDPMDKINSEELKKLSPSITFLKDGGFKIMWDHKLLSIGKYVLEGNIIRITENIPGGKTRQFPFLIVSVDDHTLKFQTMVQDATIVTAKRIK